MTVNERTLRELTRRAIDQLGPRATEANVKRLVNDAVASMEAGSPGSEIAFVENTNPADKTPSNRMIITAFGKNHPGILSEITQSMSKYRCDIQDISQKILSDYFTMIMMVELPDENTSLTEMKKDLADVGNRLGLRILAQHEDVFSAMHRV